MSLPPVLREHPQNQVEEPKYCLIYMFLSIDAVVPSLFGVSSGLSSLDEQLWHPKIGSYRRPCIQCMFYIVH